MRREEVVIRNLIREWLVLEQATEDGTAAGEEGGQQVSKLSSLTDQLDSMLDDFESKLDDQTDDETKSVNEALGLFLAGFALSIPKIGKLALYGTSYIIKAYAAMVSKLGGGDQANKLARAKKFEEAGDAFYEKTHGWILSFYAKVVELLFIAAVSYANPPGAKAIIELAKSEELQAGFMKVAKAIDFTVNLVLAVVAAQGAWGALNLGSLVAAATETGFAAIKISSVIAAISANFSEIIILFTKVLAMAGIAAALVSEVMDKIREVFDSIRDVVIDGVQIVKKTAVAAGVVIALATGPNSDDDGRNDSSRDDVAQVEERRFRHVRR